MGIPGTSCTINIKKSSKEHFSTLLTWVQILATLSVTKIFILQPPSLYLLSRGPNSTASLSKSIAPTKQACTAFSAKFPIPRRPLCELHFINGQSLNNSQSVAIWIANESFFSPAQYSTKFFTIPFSAALPVPAAPHTYPCTAFANILGLPSLCDSLYHS